MIHPYISGAQVGVNGEFVNSGDRSRFFACSSNFTALTLPQPRADDFVVPHLDALRRCRASAGTWRGGPYAQLASDLLDAHASGLKILIKAYEDLARRVASRRIGSLSPMVSRTQPM